MLIVVCNRVANGLFLLCPQLIRNHIQRFQNATVSAKIIEPAASRGTVDMEPLRPRLVRHAQLAKIGVKRLVREALSRAIVKDGSPLPLQLRQRIGGVCLLLDASLYILLLGVSDFCPSVVVCDLRRGVGINHGECLLRGI